MSSQPCNFGDCGVCAWCVADARESRPVSRADEREGLRWPTDLEGDDYVEALGNYARALERKVKRHREALEQIAETARWYANNPQRLQHEVDHALCVEVVSVAEDALDGRAALGDEQG